MDRRGYQQYKQQSVGSMTPGELLLLLYDELVKRATMASIALDKEDFPAFEAAVDRCTDIVNYLDETLDRQYPISRDLSRMYEYFTYQLGRIKIGRNKKELEQLRPLLADMRDAFHAAERNSGVPQERDGQQI
ncbi:MAG: flagellar protein FliS [Oscillospiraceae bacterium]|nr:flagellar protein FliS [Oscillospiraceae bacterium]